MSEFDVIVVGAGPAGSSAAIKMASQGLKVLLVERGDPVGSKNVSGGILWGNDLASIIPDWEKSAPLERYVERKVTSFLTGDSEIAIDFKTKKFQEKKTGYSVLRTRLDSFLARKAAQAGAMVVTGVTVDSLARKDGRVIGVVNEGETITADCVILAEGPNPRVAMAAGLVGKPNDRTVGIGVKHVYKLGENVINERFNLRGNAGFAGEYVLSFLEGDVYAGGFLYTNKDTVSMGVVINMATLRKNGNTHSFDIMEKFAQHPFISSLVEGGQLQEYSAHFVYEGGYEDMPRAYGNGYMLVGDTAGFSFSNGMILQGMNYAISSGILAGEAAIEAKKDNDFSAESLSRYQKKLDNSPAVLDKKNFQGISNVVWSPMVHRAMPALLESSLYSMLYESGNPKKHLSQIMMKSLKSSGMSSKDLMLQGYRLMRRM
ncbi:MAG: FAD-dependent oxidoreductase [Thermoplasmataceae archaeon]|jgi:electron transfer flavoprotein-quinone oxidoreductase